MADSITNATYSSLVAGIYEIQQKQGEGTFSDVMKARSISDGKSVAIKWMKRKYKSKRQVLNLGEIQAFRVLAPHANIIELLDVLFDERSGHLAMIFELMDKTLYDAIKDRSFAMSEHKIRKYIYQMLKGLDHVHSQGLFHRDIKPENILINERTGEVKLADFGCCRKQISTRPFTDYISTRWYRSPECLLTPGNYDTKMDIWGVGCVFYELLTLTPLFPGANEIDQIRKINGTLGAWPFSCHCQRVIMQSVLVTGRGLGSLLPNISQDGLELLQLLLAYDPTDRISARDALRHQYFYDLR
eukprot:Selendium_serpulae@DN6253_c0_g1_i10.p1